jgi:hypothetical protein
MVFIKVIFIQFHELEEYFIFYIAFISQVVMQCLNKLINVISPLIV